MKNSNGAQPAFPFPAPVEAGISDIAYDEVQGLTKREYFAGQAMVAMLANPAIIDAIDDSTTRWIAEKSSNMADAMLAESVREYVEVPTS